MSKHVKMRHFYLFLIKMLIEVFALAMKKFPCHKKDY